MAGNVKRETGNLFLEVKGLRVAVAGNEILKGVDLTMREGEVHAIMGPNGSGKSTLAQVLAGHPAYSVLAGTVTYDGKDLLDMNPEERARDGVFLAFQYPVDSQKPGRGGARSDRFPPSPGSEAQVHRMGRLDDEPPGE